MSQVFNSLSGEFESLDEVSRLEDWNLEKAFNEWRHTLRTEKSPEFNQEVSRVKERLKTISVALVLCLNVGVDPPDIVKPQPCAKTECWVDPFTMPPDKALDVISINLLKQYENYHPKARYKLALDLKSDDVKKLCTSLRRNAKDDRVLFHYNGHGVPKPTVNGEIWVFNKDYTQYLPLSIYDLQDWMGSNSVYVFDCSSAGEVIKNFQSFVSQRDQEYQLIINSQRTLEGYNITHTPPNFNNSILFGACSADQILPMNPELPADLFTCCLTTPIKTSLKYYMIQKSNRLLPGITEDLIDNIPGQLSDRRTMLGELNWILTAIVDSIAWDILRKETFQKMFRQDLLVSLLSRHFILAQRIMSSYDCTPVSSPHIPAVPNHPMWSTWDYVLDQCLSQLPNLVENSNSQSNNSNITHYVHSTFFTEQLTAFQTWLSFGARLQHELKPKVEQLPIVLQVLLSHVHRLRALELFSRFLSLGDWAVDMALSVGIFPYILKLLQSQDHELRPLLVYMWSKIVAIDFSAQNDLIYDNAYKYFLQVLSDTAMLPDFRTMAAFVLACFVRNFEKGQNLAFKGNLIATCLEQLNDPNALLRQWLCICLGLTWANCRDAKWCGVRDSAHEKLFVLLSDKVPDVRASAVFALGTFINLDKTDHSNTIDESIGIKLIHSVGNDGNPLVRKELIAALQWLVLFFEKRFISVAYQMQEEEKRKNKDDSTHLSPTDTNYLTITSTTSLLSFGKTPSTSRERVVKINSPVKDGKFTFGNSDSTPPSNNLMKRVSSSNSLSTYTTNSFRGIENVYVAIWKQLNVLANDPHHDVSQLANTVIDRIKSKLTVTNESIGNNAMIDSLRESHSDPSFSEPSSPVPNSFLNESMQKQSNSSKNKQDSRQQSDGCSISGRKERQSSETIINQTGISSSYTHNRERQSSEGSNGPTLNRLAKHNQQPLPILQYSYTNRRIFGKEPIDPNKPNPSQDKDASCKPLVETHFIEWCIKYFNEYSLKYMERSDPESEYNQRREWKCLQNASIRKAAKEELIRIDASKADEIIFAQKSINLPNLIKFHPYEPYLFVAEQESFSVWNWETNQTGNSFLGNFSNGNAPKTKITSMQLINPSEWTATMFACDDGSVRLWKLHSIYPDSAFKPKLVTAFDLFTDTVYKTTGTLLQREQKNLTLCAASDNKICIWDAVHEMKVRELITGSDAPPVNTLHSNDANLICVGCQDGSLRIFDKRSQNNLTFRSVRSSPIINAHIFPKEDKYIISGTASGEIKFWDRRNQSKPVRMIQIPGNASMAAMSVHETADVFACATNTATQSQINIYTLDGSPGSIIKYREGFMSQHLAPISCLAHHPYKINLAMGSTDSAITIFTSTKSFFFK